MVLKWSENKTSTNNTSSGILSFLLEKLGQSSVYFMLNWNPICIYWSDTAISFKQVEFVNQNND